MGVSTALMIMMGVSTAAAVGTGIYEAVNQPTAPTSPTTAQTNEQQAQAAQAAALAQAHALTERKGMASTMLTSPTGATGAPTVGKATLGA